MKQKAFTLVELVVTMVLLGITSTMVLTFISNGTLFYMESLGRAEVSSFSNNTIMRLKKEISLSIPYQLTVTDSCSDCNVYSNKLNFVVPFHILDITNKQIFDIDNTDNPFALLNNDGRKFYFSLSDFHKQNYQKLYGRTLVDDIKSGYVGVVTLSRKLERLKVKSLNDLGNGNYYITLEGTSIPLEFLYRDTFYLINDSSYRSFYVNKFYELVHTEGSIEGKLNIVSSENSYGSVKVKALKFSVDSGNDKNNSNAVNVDIVSTCQDQIMAVKYYIEALNYEE
jgi:prepilin-type N-terminal cleavage/methylation domain-containing protein